MISAYKSSSAGEELSKTEKSQITYLHLRKRTRDQDTSKAGGESGGGAARGGKVSRGIIPRLCAESLGDSEFERGKRG